MKKTFLGFKNKKTYLAMFIIVSLLVLALTVGIISIFSSDSKDFTMGESNNISSSQTSTKIWEYEGGCVSYVGADSPTILTVPNEIDNKTIKTFKASSMPNSVQKLLLPETVTSIDTTSFSEFDNLEEIIIDNESYGSFNGNLYSKDQNGELSTLLIVPAGKKAFEIYSEEGGNIIQNSNLRTIILPEGVTKVMPYAFAGSRVQQIIFPSSLVKLEKDSLAGINSLVQVVLNSDLTELYVMPKIGVAGGPYVWIKDGDVPIEITTISSSGVYYVEGAEKPIDKQEDGWTLFYDSTDNKHYISGVPSGSGELIIPSKILSTGGKIIEIYGFGRPKSEGVNNISGYSSVTIEHGIKVIMYYAFKDCIKLTSVSISDSVVNIGVEAFAGCTNLTTVDFGEDSELSILGNAAFSGCESLESITLSNNLTHFGGLLSLSPKEIVHGVHNEQDYIFSNCYSLTEINVGTENKNFSSVEGVLFDKQQLALYAYPNAKGSSYSIPNSVIRIRWYAFKDCINLTSVTIPDRVTSIDRYSFFNCLNLKNIIIPDSVSSIDYYSFYGCIATEKIVLGEKVTNLDGFSLNEYEKLKTINVSDSNKEFKSDEEGVALLSKNGQSLIKYAGNNAKTSYTLPTTVTTIGREAFSDCLNLTNIIFSTNLKNIERLAFNNCPNLKSITIPDNVSNIAPQAFSGIELEEITLGIGFKNIDSFDFSNYINLKSIKVSAGNSIFKDDNGRALLSKDGKTLYKYALENEQASYIIPNGVIRIANSAFENCKNLTSVTIADSVEKINSSAFSNCSKLASITIPNSVTEISRSAFSNCTNLEEVVFQENNQLNYVGLDAFYNTSWYNSLPNGVVYLGKMVYAYKGNMAPNTKIELNEGVYFIGSNAFKGYTNLESITIPASVKGISPESFKDCSNLKTVSFIEDSQLQYIDYSTFEGCIKLTSITIPEGVKTIGNNAFKNCSEMTSIIIPNSITSIGNTAFYACSNLKNITLGAGLKNLNGFDFNNYSNFSITFNKGIQEIGGHYTFKNFTQLTSINIPNTVSQIGDNVFCGCTNLKTVNFEKDSIMSNIGSSAFENTGFTSITIPSTVTSIGDYAFRQCRNLKTITLPTELKTFGSDVFYVCNNLVSINIESSNVYYSTKDGILFNKEETVLLTYPSGAKGLYVIPEGVQVIGPQAFYACMGLTSLTVPASVTKVSDYAFHQCESLTAVVFEADSQLIEIGARAFLRCKNINSITIPDGVKIIGKGAFENCSSLTFINIPDNADMTVISRQVFYGCSKLTSITIPENIEIIGYESFYDCSKLVEINFEGNSKLTNIEDRAFLGCKALTSITVPTEVTNIGSSTFQNCILLESIYFEENSKLESIGNYAFYNCNKLISITLGKEFSTFNEKSFYGCAGLINIYIDDANTEYYDIDGVVYKDTALVFMPPKNPANA